MNSKASMRFSAFSARCSALARAVSTRARRSLTCTHSSEIDTADAGPGIVALVEFVRFARGGELGSNGCVRFRGRSRALVVSTVIDSSSFDSLSNSKGLPFGPFLPAKLLLRPGRAVSSTEAKLP